MLEQAGFEKETRVYQNTYLRGARCPIQASA